MDFINEIPQDNLKEFKKDVKDWLDLNKEIAELDKKSRELKKERKNLEPNITQFMNTYNVSELNTGSGKVKCCERNTKKGLNKHNIRDNLSTILNDDLLIEKETIDGEEFTNVLSSYTNIPEKIRTENILM